MGKKILCALFVCVFLLLSMTLSLGILAAGPSEAGANERLSKAPVLMDEDGKLNTSYLSEAAGWINDHFFLRQELISLNNWLKANVFATSGTDDVLLGKDGWLFYGSTLDDFTGRDPMTQRQLCSAANNIALMAEYARSQGREFAFMIAPNKNSLYPQFMKDYGAVSEVHDAHRLQQLLEQMGVSYIDLFAVLGEADKEAVAPLYFAHDSHWNEMGAALAADVINARFGKTSSYYQRTNFSYPIRYTGDLYEMVYPAFADTEDSWFYSGEALEYEFTSKATQPDSITLLTGSEETGSLLVYRDSFGNLLYPYLADSYGSVRFSRATSYDLTQEGEYVLIELVERNLRYLITYVPVMESPVRDIALPENASGTAQIQSKPKSKAPEGWCLWQGELPVQPDDFAGVHVACGETVYGAFCLENNGYAVYLPENEVPDALAFIVDGNMQTFTIQ